jgi:N-acetyl sugar amidotransferase
MKCKRCLLTDEIPSVTIGELGQCNFCDLHDTLESQSLKIEIQDVIRDIRKRGRKSKYDCIMGISGGFDSSFLLHLLVTEYKLRVLAFHFDNGWNGKEAKANMRAMVKGTGVEFIKFSMNNKQLNALNLAFLKAGVTDADIPNDMAMSKYVYEIAEHYKIKTIINGHNFRYEGSSPLGWSYMDAKYIQSVAKAYDVNINTYPILTFWDQINAMRKGIKSIRPLYYIQHNKEEMKIMLKEKYSWQDYGGNHGENIYTEFVGGYLLPLKFGINKKILYRSAELRSGFITREVAEKESAVSEFNPKKLKRIEKALGVSVDEIMDYPITDRKQFKSYHDDFKRWSWLVLIGVKLGYFPMTFYKKYCI